MSDLMVNLSGPLDWAEILDMCARGCMNGRSCAEWPQLPGACRAAIARIAELEAIVGKLPITADGVRVVPGQQIWWWPSDRPYRPNCYADIGSIYTAIPVDGGSAEPMCECYSSREAADAALAAKGGE